MNQYFHNDLKVIFNFNTSVKQLLVEKFGEYAGVFSDHYQARIIHNTQEPDYITIKVYYLHSEYLFEKIQYLEEQNISVLKNLSTKPSKQPLDYPDKLDFSLSNLIEIETSNYWEHDKKPLLLKIDNLNLIVHNRYAGDGRFQLTENVFYHLEKYIVYGQLGRYRVTDPFIDEYKKTETSFGDIRFGLAFEHYYGKSTRFGFEILRDAYLNITDDSGNLTHSTICDYADLLISLMSFYWQKNIDYFIGKVRVINEPNYQTKEIYKYSEHAVNDNESYLLETSYPTFYDFIESLDYNRVTRHRALLIDIIPRIIWGNSFDEISKFMLFYNLIESIRNYCMDNEITGATLEIKEEFDFKHGKDKTRKLIKSKLEEVVDFVEETDKAEFLSQCGKKVSFIKKTGLIDQFESLLHFLDIDSGDYKIDFTELIKTRNSIYHGNKSNMNLEETNDQILLLISDLVLKLIKI